MNDRFLFRAWNKKRKKMYEVLHLHLASYSEGEWATVKGWCCIEQKDIHIQIQPKDIVLVQCTGLKDSTGKLIFEGDKIQVRYLGEIVSCSVVWDKRNGWTLPEIDEDLYEHHSLKIIGNIYENKELLES
jgi:uncharacterized phage protein (TIGR01671 family)